MDEVVQLGRKSLKSNELKLFESRRGHAGGTWAHPKLAVFFARWLDVRFAVWCDSVIDELIRGPKADVFKAPAEPLPTRSAVRIPVSREESFRHMETYRPGSASAL